MGYAWEANLTQQLLVVGVDAGVRFPDLFLNGAIRRVVGAAEDIVVAGAAVPANA